MVEKQLGIEVAENALANLKAVASEGELAGYESAKKRKAVLGCRNLLLGVVVAVVVVLVAFAMTR